MGAKNGTGFNQMKMCNYDSINKYTFQNRHKFIFATPSNERESAKIGE